MSTTTTMQNAAAAVMMKRMTNWIVCAALAAFATAVPAQGKDVPAASARAIRTVIEAQLNAFANHDAARAFAYAAPPIQAMFGNPDNFMRMVRTGYPVVYRPASVVFLKPETIDGEVLQAVQMTDNAGQVWMANYRMQQQNDKSWRIGGCQVEKSEGRVT